MQMTKTKVLKATDQFIVTAMAALFLLLSPPASANERIRTLGKDTLGETVKEFRIRYPKARCGKITSIEITAQSLVDPGNSDDIHCCLNDKDSLTEVSRFPILNLDGCAVHAIFWKNRLCSLSYILDVRSVQIVLHDFERLYGQPTRMGKDPEDTTRLIFVDWMEGMTSLALSLSRLGGEDFAMDSTHLKGAPWLEVVSINLCNSDLGTARN
jgi:hypothetical protein